MKYMRNRKISIWGSLLLPIIVIGCSGTENKTELKQERVISIKGMQTALSSKELNKSFTGTLEGERHAVITARISEAVEKVNVTEGDDVKAEQILISLDKTGSTSSYRQTYSVYKNAEKNYNKIKYLYDEGAVSESQYDGAKTEYEVSKANFDAAEKMVDIRTPINGTVTSISVSVGDYLYPGQKVATIAAIKKLRMNLGVSDADISYFNVGDEVTVAVESLNEFIGLGKVVTVAGSADPETRTFQVELEINNPTLVLKPGMFARAQIVLEKFENIMVIPRNAAVNRDNVEYVFVVNNGRVAAREVVLGAEFNGAVQIIEGINPGDTIVTVGQDYLDDGYQVKLVRFVNAEGEEIEL